jgi:hypothetical protein
MNLGSATFEYLLSFTPNISKSPDSAPNAMDWYISGVVLEFAF